VITVSPAEPGDARAIAGLLEELAQFYGTPATDPLDQRMAQIGQALFAGAPAGAFPLTLLFDRAGARGRLFGLRLEGTWMHVGTPDAVAAAEAALAATT